MSAYRLTRRERREQRRRAAGKYFSENLFGAGIMGAVAERLGIMTIEEVAELPEDLGEVCSHIVKTASTKWGVSEEEAYARINQHCDALAPVLTSPVFFKACVEACVEVDRREQ